VLETESNKLEVKFMARKKDCHVKIKFAHWEGLKEYWSKLETKKKVEHMSNARSKVKNMANVGQIRKTRKETKLVFAQTKLPSLNFD